MKIASLLASGTELVCALGAGDELVARSHECDTPAWVKRLPQASRPTFPIDGTSAEIDALVRRKLAAGEPLYQVDEELLTRLAPDVILTQTHCEVCAVSPQDLLCRTPVVALTTGSLDGILDGFRAVARVIGREAAAETLIAGIQARLADIRARVAGRPRPRVVCLEWIEPPFNMGNWGPEIVALAGGEDPLGTAGAHSTSIPWQRVRDADPDVLLVAPCGFDLERAWGDLPALLGQPGFAELRAVRAGRAFMADGNVYFNRSSPSVFTTVELLAELLHPDLFPPRFSDLWRRVEPA